LKTLVHAIWGLALTIVFVTQAGCGGGSDSGGAAPATGPTGFSYTSPLTFTVGEAIAPMSPTVDGSGALENFTVQPELPAGLSIDRASGAISGTPTLPVAAAVYAITAQASSGMLTFDLSIAVVIPAPSGLTYSSPQTYIVGTAIAPLNPSVTGTAAAYSVIPALPAGLSLNVATGQITGTPSSAAAATGYDITAMNSTGSVSFELLIAVLIPAPSALSYASPQSYTTGLAITGLNPTVNGTVDSYGVSPALPAGLTLNAGTGQITGTPTVAQAAANYTLTAYNSTGSTSFTLSIQVLIPAPSSLSYHSPQIYPVGTAIAPLYPTVTGPVSSYTVNPALPPGMSINAASGVITGTPTAATGSANYRITASNSSGSTSFTLVTTVVLLPPRALSYPSPRSLTVGVPIVALNPFVIGVVTTYSANPALPAGLSINSGTGQITGTPTTLSAAATYTITAANASGSTTFGIIIAVATVGVTPANISRMVATGTPLVVQLAVSSQSFSGSIHSQASDPSSLFKASVSVAPANGTYAFALTVSPTIAAGHYTGSVTLSLCSDQACTMPLSPASVAVPFDVYVLSSSSSWPGNNLTTLAPYPGVPDWTMYQGNAAHTGYVPVSLDPNSFSTRWRGPSLGNQIGYNASEETLTTSDGQLFLPNGLALYALNELDASQVWTHDFSTLATPSINPPSVANSTVYVVAGQQTSTALYALNASDGTLVFQSPLVSQFEHHLAPTIGAQGVYTNAGEYGGLYGFSSSGQQLFFEQLAQTSEWTPAVDDSYVYSYTGPLTISDPVSGALIASIQDPTFSNYVYTIGGSVVLGAPGSVFAANYSNAFLNGGGIGNTLLDFDVNHQTIAWQVAGDYENTPAYHAGILYSVNNNPFQLEARSESDGSLLWSWTPPQVGDSTFTSEVLLTDTLVFVSTQLGIYGIDVNTRQTVWSYPLVGRLALSQSGILYIQGQGPLIAINVK
jgi:hypothetical protein